MLGYDLNDLPHGSERKVKHYYVNLSVGIACGMMLASLPERGAGDINAHAEPDGVSKRNPETAEERKAVFTYAGRLSGRRRKSPEHHKESGILDKIESGPYWEKASNYKLIIANIDLPQR